MAEHHDQRLVGGVIEVGGAAGFGQPHGDPVGLEEGDDVQGLPAGEGRIECTHIFYDEDPGTSSFAAIRPLRNVTAGTVQELRNAFVQLTTRFSRA